ncbi:MAG: hypothetical protein DRJ55_00905 [Thermoprotei archaeon]|nr:MAG: hypothetical protein DRJ55_00905 [Thermoprotei archaeon]
MFKKLVLLSIISVNLGYTFFLFPLLGVLYPDRIPFTLYNLSAFILVNTMWGIILAVIVYFIVHIAKISLVKAITYSIASLWIIFWLILILSTRNTSTTLLDNVVIISVDGVSAFIVWAILSKLAEHFIVK